MITSFLNLYAAATLGSAEPQVFFNDPQGRYLKQYEAAVPASVLPVKRDTNISPLINAGAGIIVDFDSGEILFEKNSNQKMQIASLTKLMTATVALEEGNLDEIINISQDASLMEGSKIWLLSGERMSLRNLLYAILIHSGNDAAYAVAEHFGNGDVKKFVEKMNQKAEDLGLIATHFENPIGFDARENYSTAYELSLLARYAYRKPFIREAAKTKSMTVSSSDGKHSHELSTTNDLLGSFLRVLGLKTGTTDLAGQCLVSVVENNDGRKIITVILNSPARFSETKSLASWSFKSYIW